VTKVISYTLGELASLLKVALEGDERCVIDGLASLQDAQAGKLSFLSNPVYISQLADTRASAVILSADMANACRTNKLISPQPYVSYARASQLFDRAAVKHSGVHASACVDKTAILGKDCYIAANAVVEAGVVIGNSSYIGPGSVIGEGSRVGARCRFHANVTLYHDVSVGDHVELHSGVVIGADGFGFAFNGRESVKIAQLGSVIIGSHVEIGACSTIDRGALENTVIEDGVKIDNQVQIGHNCKIGEHTVICGCSAVAGSVRIGRYCVLGGGSGVVGHIHIADRVKLSAMSLVSQSIDEAGTYSSGTGLMETTVWKKNIVRFRQLDSISKRLAKLEKKLPRGKA
jgi:UDP-3-O-[3-hydroxymyristoyl] glucosamine N-acyltransferase